VSLPHVSFDNHEFLSAPSLADYKRAVVDLDGASRTVSEVVSALAEHKTYTGVAIVNGDSTTEAMGLADVLTMRRREAEWFLHAGGTIACFAHPDVAVKGVRGLKDWRRYSWLPAPEGFDYSSDLQTSFGKVGAEAVHDHPFAGYIDAFGKKAGYRVRLNEDIPDLAEQVRIFARSEGGAAIGFDLSVLNGSIVFLPPLIRLEAERSGLAQVLFECFESKDGAVDEPPRVTSELS
ncbi:MAG: hypothetical protein ACE5FA_09000, partial [Dehalococcoidia bacterium]